MNKRQLFEEYCQRPDVQMVVKFPLGAIVIDGKFIKYFDSDTDSAWLGFQMGLAAQKKHG